MPSINYGHIITINSKYDSTISNRESFLAKRLKKKRGRGRRQLDRYSIFRYKQSRNKMERRLLETMAYTSQQLQQEQLSQNLFHGGENASGELFYSIYPIFGMGRGVVEIGTNVHYTGYVEHGTQSPITPHSLFFRTFFWDNQYWYRKSVVSGQRPKHYIKDSATRLGSEAKRKCEKIIIQTLTH